MIRQTRENITRDTDSNVRVRFLHDEGFSPSYFFMRKDATGFAEHQTKLASDWIKANEDDGLTVKAEPFLFEPLQSVLLHDPAAKPKMRYMLNAIRAKWAWQKPSKRPTKLEGRKGTKRAWKRNNPPKFTLVAEDKVSIVSISAVSMHNLLNMWKYGEV
jgi:hypothetical protein